MKSHRCVRFVIRTILGCFGLFSAQFVASQEWASTFVPSEPEAAIEAHRLTLGRQFVLFNQVLFGGKNSPQLSIRYAYDPQQVQRWILDSADEEARLQFLAALAKERSDVMLIPPSSDMRRRSYPFSVSVDRPSTLASYGEYEVAEGYTVSVPEHGAWSIKAAEDEPVFLAPGAPELVFDLQIASNQKALIGLDTKIEGLDYESFLIEGPLVPPQMEAAPPTQPEFPGQ